MNLVDFLYRLAPEGSLVGEPFDSAAPQPQPVTGGCGL